MPAYAFDISADLCACSGGEKWGVQMAFLAQNSKIFAFSSVSDDIRYVCVWAWEGAGERSLVDGLGETFDRQAD